MRVIFRIHVVRHCRLNRSASKALSMGFYVFIEKYLKECLLKWYVMHTFVPYPIPVTYKVTGFFVS